MRAEYGDDPDMWPEGVRPADDAKEQQLIGGDDDYDGPGRYYPGYTFTTMT